MTIRSLSLGGIALVAALSLLLSCAGTDKAAKPSASGPALAQGSPLGSPPGGNPPGPPPGGFGDGPGGSGSPGAPGGTQQALAMTAAFTIESGKAEKRDFSLSASAANQSVVIAKGASTLVLSGLTAAKEGGDTTSEDNSNFSGQNAAIVAEGGAKISLSASTVRSAADGSNAVFCTGSGSSIEASGLTIRTTGNSSRGLDATYGGSIAAAKVDIQTAGTHCAALATDRGEGTVSVSDSVALTTGVDSPAIYSTGAISAARSTLTATGSEAAVIEGKNSIDLEDVTLAGARKRGVMLYQSFSGDAAVGTSRFSMKGGSLDAAEGPLFFVTNTRAVVELAGVKALSGSGVLLRAAADSWGNAGSNGGTVSFSLAGQALAGSVSCDGLSSASFTLAKDSSLMTAINAAEKTARVSLALDASSRLSLAGDCYLSAFTDGDLSLANVESGGHSIFYDASASANAWLDGRSLPLSGGGTLTPLK